MLLKGIEEIYCGRHLNVCRQRNIPNYLVKRQNSMIIDLVLMTFEIKRTAMKNIKKIL
jgi:hypothetical protein